MGICLGNKDLDIAIVVIAVIAFAGLIFWSMTPLEIRVPYRKGVEYIHGSYQYFFNSLDGEVLDVTRRYISSNPGDFNFQSESQHYTLAQGATYSFPGSASVSGIRLTVLDYQRDHVIIRIESD
jgi:hypothetical protein